MVSVKLTVALRRNPKNGCTDSIKIINIIKNNILWQVLCRRPEICLSSGRGATRFKTCLDGVTMQSKNSGKTMKKLQLLTGLVAGLGFACVSHATAIDFTASAPIGAGTLASPLTWLIGDNTITATAYYTSDPSLNQLQAAVVTKDPITGLGITGPVVTGESSPGTAPYNSIENNAGIEFLLIDLGATATASSFNASGFQIGYSGGSATNIVNNPFQATPDVQFWTGGGMAGALNLVGACVVGSACGGVNFSTLGFVQRPLNTNTAVNVATAINPASGATAGRYVIVSGALGPQLTNGSDSFRLKSLKIPEPSSVALLGLGLLGFMLPLLRRKS